MPIIASWLSGSRLKKGKVLALRAASLLLVLALVVAAMPAIPLVSASTEVGGTVSADTTWTAANSPYVVTSTVVVSAGVTLTVEPGVTVRFEPHTGLQVDGGLIARGSEAAPILFTSNQSLPGWGDWLNISFSDSSLDTSYDAAGSYLGGSILQFVTVEYGGEGDNGAVKINSSSLLIDSSTIRTNASRGLDVANGAARLTDSMISGNLGGGIYAYEGTLTINASTISGNSTYYYGGGIYASDVTLTINSSTITSNSAGSSNGGGIYASGGTLTINSSTVSGNSAYSGGGVFVGSGTTATINDSAISGNSGGDYGGGIRLSSGTLTISASTISGNSAGSGSGGGIHASGGTLTINSSTISGNSANYGGGGIYAQYGTLTISASTVSGNSTTSYGGGIFAYSGTLTIDNSAISGNSANYGGGISASGGTLTIDNSTISSNWANSGGGMYVDGGDIRLNASQISENTFLGIVIAAGQPLLNGLNIHDNALYDLYNATTLLIDATGNWWGTTDEATIQARIYDRYDDGALGLVVYTPYRTGPVDLTPPAVPTVVDDGDYTSSSTAVHATWSSSDPESGVAEYSYAAGSSPGAGDIVAWTSAGAETSLTLTGLSLVEGQTYYIAVKARNGDGVWSDAGASDGITVRRGAGLALSPAEATAAPGETFDVEIRVDSAQWTVDGAQAFLRFDPTYLQVGGVTPGTALPLTLGASPYVDNEAGYAGYGAGVPLGSSTFPSGAFVLATVQFTALLQTTPATTVSFLFDAGAGRLSRVSWQGDDVLIGPVVDGTIEIVSNLAPSQPVNSSPANGAASVTVPAVLQSSTFADPDEGALHAASQWQVTDIPGDYSSPVFESGPDSTHLTEVSVSGLTGNATYYWRVRYQDNHRAWSGWSAQTSFSTANRAPQAPANVSPAAGDTGVGISPALQSSAFVDLDSSDSHAASQWQLTGTAGDYSAPLFDSSARTDSLTSIALPSGRLDNGSIYYWRVRHQDAYGAWSDWSAETRFTTQQGVVLRGTLALQGQASVAHDLTITLRDSAGGEASYSVTTDALGNFEVTGLNPGAYDIAVDGPRVLRNVRLGVVLSASQTVLDLGELREGDVDDDGDVDLADFELLNLSYIVLTGQEGYDDRANFNRDNIVDVIDFSLLHRNFGQASDPW